MQQPLLVRLRLLVVLWLGLGLAARPALATHLLGGEITYRYLDSDGPDAAPLRYEITLTLYNNCLAGAVSPASSADIAIYNQATGTQLNLTALNSSTASGGDLDVLPSFQSGCVSPAVPAGCTITGPTQPYIVQRFVAVVNLPNTTTGYYVVYTQGNRNNDITNLANPGGAYLSLYTSLAPPAIPNRSPVFADIAVALLCANDTTFYLTNAIDADGDRLVYTFGTPYSLQNLPTTFTPPPTPVTYNAGYSASNPFGTGRGVLGLLNVVTGVGIFATPTQGKYVIAVDVKEYRTINGAEKLIGTTRRDVQLVVATCPATTAPRLPSVSLVPRAYTVTAGTPVSFPIVATQADGHPLTMTVRSELLDGPGGSNATFNGSQGNYTGSTGTVVATGTGGSVGSSFMYTPGCAAARNNAYDVLVQVQDNGCAGKTVFDVFRITVVKPLGPTAIAGSSMVCAGGTTTYTASGGNSTGVAWTVTGGTIVGSATANPVTVQWGTAGTGTLTATGTTSGGCASDPFSKTVTISAPPALTVSGATTVCPGSSTTITVAGAAQGSTYAISGGPATGTGPGFVLSPTATTTYTITTTASGASCPTSTQVTVTVSPAVVANAGANVTTTSGVAVAIGGAPQAGYTYSWSPATGLSSASSANPTVTLLNTTGAALTQTYTLTATNPATGCVGTGTVTVTVNVDPTLTFPNVITPNGDRLNDRLVIKNVRSYPGNTLEIYNRWGRQIFATANYDNDTNYWGTDASVAAGVYYFLFKQANGTTTKGWVEVVK